LEQDVAGSGVIVSPDGFIVTNAHVVKYARRIDVTMLRTDDRAGQPHAHQMTAKLIGLDDDVDIAVIKIEGQKLPFLSFLDSDQLRQGQIVLAVGSPLGLQNSLRHGIVNATARQVTRRAL
jgi:S1-C subfamily serine protease